MCVGGPPRGSPRVPTLLVLRYYRGTTVIVILLQYLYSIVAPVRQFSILGAAVRAPGAWCGLYTLVNRNNDVTSLYTCLSRKNYRNCSRVGRRDR